MPERVLINPHIEKTAGRSTRRALIGSYGAESVLLYRSASDGLIRASDRIRRAEETPDVIAKKVVRNPALYPFMWAARLTVAKLERHREHPADELPQNFSAISGHFSGDRFVDSVPPEEADYVSVVREPLDRMRSHYQHWRDTGGKASFRLKLPYKPNMGFEEFAFLEELRNYQTTSLGVDPSRYRLIGVLEQLPAFLEELGLVENPRETPHVGGAIYSGDYNHDEGFVVDFKDFHAADYELYQNTASSWE